MNSSYAYVYAHATQGKIPAIPEQEILPSFMSIPSSTPFTTSTLMAQQQAQLAVVAAVQAQSMAHLLPPLTIRPVSSVQFQAPVRPPPPSLPPVPAQRARFGDLQHIGTGAYGSVYRAVDRLNGGREVALKKIRISSIEEGITAYRLNKLLKI